MKRTLKKTAIIAALLAALLGFSTPQAWADGRLGIDERGKAIQALGLSNAQGTGATVEVVTTNLSTSTATAAITSNDEAIVRVVCSTDSYMAAGTAPTASATTSKMPAWAIEYFTLGSGQKMAFLAITAAGSCDVTKML